MVLAVSLVFGVAANIYVVDSKGVKAPTQTVLTQGKKIIYVFNIEPYKQGETYTIYIQNLKPRGQ
ncbi:hypothetical protein [Clostridium luticellarii]|uniref:SbsA Ig-like domain-containing protein n=1 Tax=Clostridium luticellarii TaxID=1691940 RepID=A0A2T0BFA3_9CLOT|nr:hypothetical protein [Clostridium luticellarii]PRR82596.1 hypothetical protein CLLU_28190 [Clostridium luticellarii]